jgi:hypothetical protein
MNGSRFGLMLTIAALAVGGSACTSSDDGPAYQPKHASLAEAIQKDYDVYLRGSAPAPSRPEEVAAWFADDDDGTDFVAIGGTGYVVRSHRRGSYDAVCRHERHRTCLYSPNGVLAEDVGRDEYRSTTVRSYTLYATRDETVVEVPLGRLPGRGAAWWAAALVDADLIEWKPSNSELRRLDELLTRDQV